MGAEMRCRLVADLCLPETRSGSIDDGVRRGSAERPAGRGVGPADGAANPSQGEMCSEFVVIAGVWRKHAAQMGLAEDDDVIEALPADRANQPLGMPILPG